MRGVDWSDLEHAYGPAVDVPDLVEALTGPEADEALSELFGSITHQGSRYPATVAAIPFLVDVALDPGAPRRAEVVSLVQFCAVGYLGDQLDWVDRRDRQVGPWERACFDAVVDQHPRLEPLLAEADSVLSGLTLALLSWTGRDSEPVRAHIGRLLAAGEETDRLAGFLAPTILGVAPPVDLTAIPGGVDRFGWAAAALRFLGDACPPAAVDELCRSFTVNRSDLADTPFFLGEEPAMMSVLALAPVPAALRDHASGTLLDSMWSGWVRGAERLIAYLRLRLGEPDPATADRLTPDQVAAIRDLHATLGNRDLRKATARDLAELSWYGLPTSPGALADLLERLG